MKMILRTGIPDSIWLHETDGSLTMERSQSRLRLDRWCAFSYAVSRRYSGWII